MAVGVQRMGQNQGIWRLKSQCLLGLGEEGKGILDHSVVLALMAAGW